MTTAGGGWTLITSINHTGHVVEVGNHTVITPETGNHTNRNMQLPGVSAILIVADGKDTGFDTAFDKKRELPRQVVTRGVPGCEQAVVSCRGCRQPVLLTLVTANCHASSAPTE